MRRGRRLVWWILTVRMICCFCCLSHQQGTYARDLSAATHTRSSAGMASPTQRCETTLQARRQPRRCVKCDKKFRRHDTNDNDVRCDTWTHECVVLRGSGRHLCPWMSVSAVRRRVAGWRRGRVSSRQMGRRAMHRRSAFCCLPLHSASSETAGQEWGGLAHCNHNLTCND